jgi:DNA-binding MarR family transcriptional regulator
MSPSVPPMMASNVAELTFKLLTSCQKKEERVAHAFGVTVPEFRILRAFRNNPNRNVKELVDALGVGGSNFSKIAASLESKGFLVRTIAPEDRRSVRASLTEKGIELSHRLEARYLEIHEEILKGIPIALQPALVQALEQLFQSLDKWLAEDS